MERQPKLELWGATLLDGVNAAPVRDAVITVRGGRVLAVRQGRPEDPSHGLDLRGKYVLPGLIDAHAHAEEEWVFAALAATGIAAIRNPATRGSGRAGTTSLLVRSAGPIIDGPDAVMAGAVWVRTEAEMRTEVRRQAALGVDYVKLYGGLPLSLVSAAVDEAHVLGLQVIGDLVATSWTDAARAGIDYLCHVIPRHASLLPPSAREQYRGELGQRSAHAWIRWVELVDLRGPEVAEMIRALVEGGVAVDPTLVGIEAMLFCGDPAYHAAVAGRERLLPRELRSSESVPRLSPEAIDRLRQRARPVWEKLLQLVGLLHRSGVSLLAGSDAPRSWVAPGVSLHRELGLLVDAGLAPAEALRAATAGAAAALGIDAEVGAVSPGRRADMVVLRADPTAVIANTTSIEWVVRGGRVHAPEELCARYA